MLVPVTFVNQIFKNFGWIDNVKSFFCIVGTSWMGWGRVEWYWHMGMSYLTSLNTQLFKNIAYVGSFKNLSVQLFLASQDALEVIVWVSQSVTLRTELTDVTLVSEDTYWRLYWETLIINDTYGGDVREIVVLIMEVDKVVDEVTDMEIDK